jgi:hypothetical protein
MGDLAETKQSHLPSLIMDNKYSPLAGMRANKKLSVIDSFLIFKLEYPIFQEALSFSSEF